MAVTDAPSSSAIDTKGADRRPALQAADGEYDVMPAGDGPVTLTFRVPEAKAGMTRTVVLDATGYYRYDLSAEGEPDRKAIQGFETEPDFGALYLRGHIAALRAEQRRQGRSHRA